MDYSQNQLESYGKCETQRTESSRNSSSGKTSSEPCRVISGTIFKPCSAKSQKPIFQCLNLEDGQTPEWFEAKALELRGESSTLNIGEFPRNVVESSLSQVLEHGDVTQKYYLSQRGCEGLIQRSLNRGKKLPPLLEQALRNQIAILSECDTE